MENINIFIQKKKPLAGQRAIPSESPYDKRSGFFGVVVEVHYKNNTVDVRSDSGRVFTNIRVASLQWVTLPTDDSTSKNKDTLTGRRHLPPKETYVYCLMPTGEPSSAIVLCSVFAYQDSGHAALRNGGEDFQYIDEHIDNGGWRFTHDIRTGTRKIQNAPKEGDETVSFEVNQEEDGKHKIIFKFYKNTLEFDEEKQGWKQEIKGDVNLTIDGKMTAAVTGDVKVTTDGNADVEAGGNLSYKSTAAGLLELGNTVATLGAMIGEFIDDVSNAITVGSPATHTMNPGTKAALASLKAKWNQVFK